MARTDARDLPISTDSDEAARVYNDGVALMLSAWPGAAEVLDTAIDLDPDFALAHAARARLHAMFAQPQEARLRIAQAQRLVEAYGDERERSHVAVLASAIEGRSKQALDQALAHLDRWPRDAVIFSLPMGAFGLLAFSGVADHDQARVDLCARHQAAYAAEDWWFLTYQGWALAENGEVSRGRSLLERALDIRRDNANGVHALAHALFEAGAGPEAEQLIGAWLPDYGRDGILHGHLAWHTALVALERGDAEGALAIYGEHVRPDVSMGMPINIVSDAASLLWRLEAYGHRAPEGLWRQVSDYSNQAFPRSGHAFVDTHMLIVAAATGDQTALGQRLLALDGMVTEGKLSAGPVVPAIGRALKAFADQDYTTCAALLEPLGREVARIGGSGAQREIVEDTLLQAWMRSGEAVKARALLDRRLDRRPSPRDALWRGQLGA